MRERPELADGLVARLCGRLVAYSAAEAAAGELMPHFNIRTTTAVYRDYAVECASEEEAKKLANTLAYADSPKDVLKEHGRSADTLRNDVDINSCVSHMPACTWNSIRPEDVVAHPE